MKQPSQCGVVMAWTAGLVDQAGCQGVQCSRFIGGLADSATVPDVYSELAALESSLEGRQSTAVALSVVCEAGRLLAGC